MSPDVQLAPNAEARAVTADPQQRGERLAARRKRGLSRAGMYLLMTIIALPFVFPIYWMFASGLKRYGDVFANPPVLWPEEPQWQNFLAPFQNGPFLQQFGNSLYIAFLVTVGVLTVASLAGYAFARIQFWGRKVLFVILLTALLIPAEVTILPLFQLLTAFGWVNTHLALIVPAIFGPPMVLGIFLMRQFFLSMPEELEQAGRIDGLGRFGLFWRIALPLAKSPMAALAILSFLSSWNELLEPLVFLRTQELWTIPQALNAMTDPYTGTPIWHTQMAAS